MTRTSDDDVRVVLAANAYLHARRNLENADVGALMLRLVELDDAYHALIVACGLSCADVGCVHDDETEGTQ